MQRRSTRRLSFFTLMILLTAIEVHYSATIVFAQAPQFTLGNSSRNPVRGPHCRNADIALIKRVHFSETKNLELRAEAFNLTNTPPLGAPNAVLGTAGFGSITSAGDPRVIQLGVKFNF